MAIDMITQNIHEGLAGFVSGVTIGYLSQGQKTQEKLVGKHPKGRVGYAGLYTLAADAIQAGLVGKNYLEGIETSVRGDAGCIAGILLGVPLGNLIGKFSPQLKKH